jgi:CRISPR-associated protein Csd1
MLLERLNEYADRVPLPPRLYSEAPVRYVIELDGAGRLLSPAPVDTANSANARERRGVRRLVPQVQRTVAVKPLLLADNAEYTLGLAREGSRPERVASCHAAYLALLDRCAAETVDPAVAAVRAFLRGAPLAQLELSEDFDRGATITFRVDGEFVVDRPAVQAFWAAVNDPDASPDQSAPVMQCIVCGAERPVLRRLQAKLKGVPGGQTSGTALISANAEAFESYGLEASLIAPTCAACGERFTKAANWLLADERHRLIVGGAAFVFWTREEVGFSPLDFFTQPDPVQVRALLESVQRGSAPPEIEATAFYATVLTGSGGRAVVRDWIDTTVGEVRRHLAEWFARQRIVGPGGEELRPFGLYALAAATVRDARTDLAPTTPRALWRAALTGAPPPIGLLYQAMRRIRAEQRVTAARAALIKLVLASQHPNGKEDAMVQLDPSSPSAAYHCGRLLAVLEEVQRLAVPSAKATIVDRFFGTASSAPASVFGRLLRGAQPHLAKLERDQPRAYRALQRRLEEVQAQLRGFPRTLTLEDQGLFALGYYHQRAYDRAEARAAAERRQGLAAAAETLPPEALGPETDSIQQEEE